MTAERDPFHCDGCGCALDDGEVFRQARACTTCQLEDEDAYAADESIAACCDCGMDPCHCEDPNACGEDTCCCERPCQP